MGSPRTYPRGSTGSGARHGTEGAGAGEGAGARSLPTAPGARHPTFIGGLLRTQTPPPPSHVMTHCAAPAPAPPTGRRPRRVLGAGCAGSGVEIEYSGRCGGGTDPLRQSLFPLSITISQPPASNWVAPVGGGDVCGRSCRETEARVPGARLAPGSESVYTTLGLGGSLGCLRTVPLLSNSSPPSSGVRAILTQNFSEDW